MDVTLHTAVFHNWWILLFLLFVNIQYKCVCTCALVCMCMDEIELPNLLLGARRQGCIIRGLWATDKKNKNSLWCWSQIISCFNKCTFTPRCTLIRTINGKTHTNACPGCHEGRQQHLISMICHHHSSRSSASADLWWEISFLGDFQLCFPTVSPSITHRNPWHAFLLQSWMALHEKGLPTGFLR